MHTKYLAAAHIQGGSNMNRDYLCVNKSQFVPVIFQPPCTSKLLATSSRRHRDIKWRIFSTVLKNVSNTRRHAAVGCVPNSIKRRSKGKVRPGTGHEGPEGGVEV
jgi:hypothetical protein